MGPPDHAAVTELGLAHGEFIANLLSARPNRAGQADKVGLGSSQMDGIRLTHPLCGSDAATLMRVLRQAGPVRPSRLPQVVIAALAMLGRLPFSLLERAYVRLRSQAATIDPPVFIVGHWRSGTTHLYNLLSQGSQFGYVSPFATALPWDFLLLGRLLEPLLARALPSGRYIDNMAVEPDSPQEDEIALANMTPLSFYHGLYFPGRFDQAFDSGVFFDGCTPEDVDRWQRTLQYFYRKLSIRQGGRRLLIKNPVYTARIGLLAQAFPGARFIHIHRSPYKVFGSMRNFYRALFAQFALQPYDHVPIDEVIFRSYGRMMDALLHDSADLPPEQFVEVRFEALQRQPMTVLEDIHRQLGLAGFAEAKPAFSRYLDSVRDYKKGSHPIPADVQDRIAERWRPYIERWGYSVAA